MHKNFMMRKQKLEGSLCEEFYSLGVDIKNTGYNTRQEILTADKNSLVYTNS